MSDNGLKRKYELDWLRVFAVLLVFVYHCTRLFNLEDWHVKNPVKYPWVEVWNVWVTRWMMPLFFVISGASLFYALDRSKGFLSFLKSKTLRLMVPVFVGMFSHGMLQVYIERISHGTFSGSIIEFIPHYFNGPYLQIGGKGNFAFHGMHLWYLLFLFVYTLMLYPLFILLKGKGRKVLESFTRVLTVPGVIYFVLPLPFFVLRLTIPSGFLNVGNGGWGFLFYIWFLIAGFIIYSEEKLLESIKRQRWVSLVLAVLITIAGLWLRFGFKFEELSYAMRFTLRSFGYVGSWVILLALFGFAINHLRMENKFLTYSNEAGIAFYILHQPIIVSLGFFIVTWGMPDILTFIITGLLSFAIIMVIYEYAIRRFNLLRFLFGMKPVSH